MTSTKFVIRNSIFAFGLLCLLTSGALAMGGQAPAKDQSKYKVEILKMEVVNAPSSFEVSLPKKALIISTGDYKEIKDGLEAKGFKVTVVAKIGNIKAKDYDAIVVVGPKLGERALRGLK